MLATERAELSNKETSIRSEGQLHSVEASHDQSLNSAIYKFYTKICIFVSKQIAFEYQQCSFYFFEVHILKQMLENVKNL